MTEDMPILLNEIPFVFDDSTFLKKVEYEKYREMAPPVDEFIQKVGDSVKPKAVYRIAYIDERAESTVNIGGKEFKSRILSYQLRSLHRVFPYVVTCGTELEDIPCLGLDGNDFLIPYWVDAVKEMALSCARRFLQQEIKTRYRIQQLSNMNPGSGDQYVWPIEQQKELFSLLGNVSDTIGVTLTPSFLMIPNKTVSGIYFPSRVKYESCRYCHRKNCPNRRVAFADAAEGGKPDELEKHS